MPACVPVRPCRSGCCLGPRGRCSPRTRCRRRGQGRGHLDRRHQPRPDFCRQRKLRQHGRGDAPGQRHRERKHLEPQKLVQSQRSGQLVPRISTGIASAPPTVAIGTIGTPARIAIFTNPLRPARLARSRSLHGRSESTSPPGHSATSRPSASAVEMASGRGGQDPHRPEVPADQRDRHQCVVRGAV